MESIIEEARSCPVSEAADVVVCGGGPAGVAAAVSSARSGAKTLLVESQGCLGGTWTSGGVNIIIGYKNKKGLIREILERLEAVDGRVTAGGIPGRGFDVEKMKLVLDNLCCESKVDVRLYTLLAAAVCNENRVAYAITESKSGRQAISGKVFIDCTGDGDLAARAGCGYDFGRPDTGDSQPMSMIAFIGGIKRADAAPFLRNPEEGAGDKRGCKERLRKEIERAGVSPSYARPTLYWVVGDLFFLMANHEYDAEGTESGDLTRASLNARREIHRIVDALRGLGGMWSRVYLVSTSPYIGVREGRRIHGRYTVSEDDLIAGRRHPDSACTVTSGIDVHSTDETGCKSIESAPFSVRPYDIPVRAMIARDRDGLMMAGRCISGDFLAHASYRVTGNAAAMGESAGLVASRAALTGRMPHEVRWSEILSKG